MIIGGKRLWRIENGKMIAGVCNGLAEYFELDPTVVRVAYVLLSLFTAFSGVVVYLILWIIMPPRNY